jgi:hypothetical protein
MFDKDNSDELELGEFVNMAKYLDLGLDKRIGIMLFRLFDRRDIGCFSYEELYDIIYKNLKPNYRRIIRMERNRWALSGADPTWPARPKSGPIKVKIPSKPIIKEIVREVEVIKNVEKRVEKVVERIQYVSAERIKEDN